MSRVYRQLDELRQLKEQTNDVTDSEQASLVAALGNIVLSAGAIVKCTQDRDQGVFLTAGTYPGFNVNCVNARISGAPGAVISSIVRIQTTCLLENLHFSSKGESSNALRLVEVQPGGIAVLKNCTFERQFDDESSTNVALGYAHLAVLLGGKAKAFNCTFRSNLSSGALNGSGFYAWSDAGNAVSHLDVVASYNPSTHVISNGTETAVVT